MRKARKRITGILLSAMVMTCNALSLQAPINTAMVANAAQVESAVAFGTVNGLKEGTYSPNKVIVLLKQAYSNNYASLVKNIFSNSMFKSYRVISNTNGDADHLFISVELKNKGANAVNSAITYLKSFSEIYYAGPNRLFDIKTTAQSVPDDPGLTKDGFTNKNGSSVTSWKSYNMIGLYDAWRITHGSKSIVVSNSEGLYYNHEDLKQQMWTNESLKQGAVTETHGANFNRTDHSIYDDHCDHGTLTAGIIAAAGNNGKGSAGVAYGTQLMSCQACGTDQFKEELEFLEKYDVRILNISQGWAYNALPDRAMTEAMKEYDGLIFVSAGNIESDLPEPNLERVPRLPAGYSQTCPNVIAVTSVDTEGNQVDCYGYQTVNIAAPSSVIGCGIYRPNNQPDANPQSNYGIGGGTSSASPVAAGVAALIWSANPALTATEVKNILYKTATPTPKLKNKVQYGLINAHQALLEASTEKGTYFFRSKANGRYLDLNTSTNRLIAHDFNAGKNQQFEFGDGTLKTSYYANNNYISKVSGSSSAQVSGGIADIAVAKDPSGKGYRILNPVRVKESGREKVELYALEVVNPSSTASDVVWKKYNPNSSNQLWYAESATPVDLSDGVYTIKNKKSGLMLDVKEADGTILQHGYNGGKNQKWRLTKISNDGSYKLQTLSTVRQGYLNRNNDVSVIKSNCMVVKLYETSEGYIRVHMPGSCWCMQVKGGSTSNYTPVIWSAANATGNDQWKIDPTN